MPAMFPMPDEYGGFEGLSDEERRRFLEAYAPGPVAVGPMTRGAQDFAPLPRPPSAAPTPLAPPDDGDLMRRFMDAQQKGARNSALSGLGASLDNAGRLYAGLPERSGGADASIRQRPVQDVMQAEALEAQQRNAGRQSELDAVNLAKTKAETARAEAGARSTAEEAAREAALSRFDSPETEAQRRSTAALLKENPNVTPELLASLNGVQLRELARTGTSQLNAKTMAGFRQQQLDMTAEQQEFQRQLDRWRLGLEKERLSQQWDISQMTLEQARELAELRAKADMKKAETEAGIAAGNKVAADTKDIAEAFDRAGGPNFYSKYGEVSELLSRYKDDIPGFGKVDGMKPDMFVSEDALAMRQGVGQMLAEYRKGITGAGMSDSERKEYGSITGLLQTNNESSVRQGVERLRRAMDARFQSLAGGFRPEAVETYSSRVPAFGVALRGSPVGRTPPQAAGTRDNPVPARTTYADPKRPDVDLEADPAPPPVRQSPAGPKPTTATQAGKPSREDRKFDPTKKEARRVYSKDGQWLRIVYTDGTFGLGPSDKKKGN